MIGFILMTVAAGLLYGEIRALKMRHRAINAEAERDVYRAISLALTSQIEGLTSQIEGMNK
jgi:hypothetical protein